MMTVAEYLVRRLEKEGVTHAFGVPGDYAFSVCGAVARKGSPMTWVGCACEMEAGYAADGFARVKGAAALFTTFGVGELSTINTVMGAKAERSCVFHIVGVPSRQQQVRRAVLHHTLGDGDFTSFQKISEQAACVSAVITPENVVLELERVIRAARAESRPAYVLVPSDVAVTQVPSLVEVLTPPGVAPSATWSSPRVLQRAVEAILQRIDAASTVAVLPAWTVGRFKLEKSVLALIERLGAPFALLPMEKGVLPESHPQCVGMWVGALTHPSVSAVMDNAALIIDAGGISLNDNNTGGFSLKLKQDRVVTIAPEYTAVGDHVFNVHMSDVFDSLTRELRKTFRFDPSGTAQLKRLLEISGAPSDAIRAQAMYARFQRFIRANDNVVIETGSLASGLLPLKMPEGVKVFSQLLWGSIGWATGAALGVAIADPTCRTILFTGEGSHQLSVAAIGTMGKHIKGVQPVIIVLHNGGYMVERALDFQGTEVAYNDLAEWDYATLPRAFGCNNWFTAKVNTLGELDAALEKANASGGHEAAYIEVMGGRLDYPPGLAYAHEHQEDLYGNLTDQ